MAEGCSPTATERSLHLLEVNGASRVYGEKQSGERAWICGERDVNNVTLAVRASVPVRGLD